MRLSTKLKLICFILILCAVHGFAQQVKSFAVMLERDGNSLPVKIKWNHDPAAVSYNIYRKEHGAVNWGNPVAAKAAGDSTFSDPAAYSGVYEYFVEKQLANNYKGHGYLLVNTTTNKLAKTQRILILIDANYINPLQAELGQLIRDYVSDGWFVDTISIQRSLTPVEVKSKIKNWFDTYKNEEVKPQSLYLLGHIPVPYSGLIGPDGHPDHKGAWPADVYYGVMNESIWTDSKVEYDSSSQLRNRNFIGDGKFDPSYIFPDTSSLEIGRVDLTDMPAFPESDTVLTRDYLIKAHAFKTHNLIPERKAIIDDHFGAMDGEAFAANGYRNYSTMLGAENIVTDDFLTSVKQRSYLLTYGSGAGTHTSAFGVANTQNLVSGSINTVFTMLFGSYFGDWDYQNSFLRAPLCSKPMALASAWSGRPNWPLHHMALGYSIGHCARLTQNNIEGKFMGLSVVRGYRNNNFPTFIHIALMGDPGLRLFYNEMPQNLTATPNSDSTRYNLKWDVIPGAVSYDVYVSSSMMQPGKRVGIAEGTGGSIQMIPVSKGVNHVYVRANYIETSASGMFGQSSLGSYITLFGGVKASGVNENDSKMNVNVFPNPSKHSITISGEFLKASVHIYDVTGKLMRSFDDVNAGETIGHGLSHGMYFINIGSEHRSAVRKLVVE